MQSSRKAISEVITDAGDTFGRCGTDWLTVGNAGRFLMQVASQIRHECRW